MSNFEDQLAFLDFILRESVERRRYRIKNKNECWKYINIYKQGRFIGSKLVRYDDQSIK